MKRKFLLASLMVIGLGLGTKAYASEEIVINELEASDMKIDGKVEPIEPSLERDEILGLLEGIDDLDVKRVDQILVKEEGSDLYQKVLYREAYLENKDEKNINLSFKLSLTKIVDDYVLKDLEKSTILGTDVVFSGYKSDFYTAYRSDFKINNAYFRLESNDIKLDDFLRINEIVIKNIRDLIKSEEGLAVPGDKSDALINKLKRARYEAKISIESARYLLKNSPETIKPVKAKLINLIERSEKLIKKADKIINRK